MGEGDTQRVRLPEASTEGSSATEDGPSLPLSDKPVEPDRVQLWENEFQRLCLKVDGKEFINVRPRRAFPLSAKADYVSLLNDKDKEVILLAHPHKLDAESKRALEKALDRMYYVPKILRVDEITEKMGVSTWKAATDRGYAHFEVVDRSQIRRLPGGRLLIVDVDGNRFEIENISKLDERSQELVASET